MSERIMDFLSKKISEFGGVEKFADFCGIDPRTVYYWEKGEKAPRKRTLAKIADALGVTLKEIYDFGISLTMEGTTMMAAHGEALKNQRPTQEDHGDFTHVPYLEATLAGSNGESVELDTSVRSYLSFQTPWLASKGSPRQMAAMRVVGDSMEPKIPDGAVVLVRVAKADTFSSGAIYAVSYDQGLNIKRVSRNEDGRWVLSSDNPSCPPKVVKEEEHFEIIGRVVWVCFDV